MIGWAVDPKVLPSPNDYTITGTGLYLRVRENRDNMTTLSNTLVAASQQWAVRPADQRFWDLQSLYAATKRYAEESRIKVLSLSQCEVKPKAGNDLVLCGPEGGEAQFQHYAFGQFSNICQAPASYLRTLPAPLAAQCLNNGLVKVDGTQNLMFHKNGGLHLRCVTSDRYQRIWDYEIAELALALEEQEGWRVPPARPCGLPGVPVKIATQSDVLQHSAHKSLGVRVGDEISPAGLYASDHDCFIFQVNEDRQIDGGNGEMLYRGVFWSNSEVGAARWRATMFLYDSICGNHIVWGAKTLAEISIRHTGEARRMFAEAMATVTQRSQVSAASDEARIREAKSHLLGQRKEDIITLIFGKQLGLSRSECEGAYVLADRHSDDHHSDPRSAWGFASGVTRLSQSKYADDRDRMDRSAGRILELAF